MDFKTFTLRLDPLDYEILETEAGRKGMTKTKFLTYLLRTYREVGDSRKLIPELENVMQRLTEVEKAIQNKE